MISTQESYVIKYIRSFAMLSIILCHLLQAYDNKWAWIFNIGVQVFLAISGWLYGNKEISNWGKWYKDKFKKLYIPYIIYVIIAFLVYQIINIKVFSIKALMIYILDMQWILGGVEGLSHLWFMTTIVFCYVITPILQFLKKHATIYMFCLCVIGILNMLIFRICLGLFSCFLVYCFSYFFACLSYKTRKIYVYFMLSASIILLHIIDWNIILDYTNNLNKLFHVLLGISIVILPIHFAYKLKRIRLSTIITLFDKYSFYAYLTHHLYMLGPLSIAYLTNSIEINISLITVLTILSAFTLKIVSDKLIYVFNLII